MTLVTAENRRNGVVHNVPPSTVRRRRPALFRHNDQRGFPLGGWAGLLDQPGPIRTRRAHMPSPDHSPRDRDRTGNDDRTGWMWPSCSS
jgi:hypothetical protein